MNYLTIFFLLFSMESFSHEGHDVPGSLPVSPHGGIIKEAKHQHAHSNHGHSHAKAVEKEIFFEGVVSNKVLKIYALELRPNNHKNFETLNTSLFSGTEIKIVEARSKKEYKLPLLDKKGHWEISLKSTKGRRFLAQIMTKTNGAAYSAEVQVIKK